MSETEPAQTFLVNPRGEATASTRTEAVAPYVCTGTVVMMRMTGRQLPVSPGFPLGDLQNHLNSRFELYTGSVAPCKSPNTDFSNAEAMQQVRERAIFRGSPGQLLLADPVSDRHIKIDFLPIPLNSTTPVEFSGSLPANPEQNRENCMADPNGAQCIRLVRARICLPESNDCGAVPYKTLVSFVPMPFGLPMSTTVVTAETLGLPPRVPPT